MEEFGHFVNATLLRETRPFTIATLREKLIETIKALLRVKVTRNRDVAYNMATLTVTLNSTKITMNTTKLNEQETSSNISTL